jgi:hypothetical protein
MTLYKLRFEVTWKHVLQTQVNLTIRSPADRHYLHRLPCFHQLSRLTPSISAVKCDILHNKSFLFHAELIIKHIIKFPACNHTITQHYTTHTAFPPPPPPRAAATAPTHFAVRSTITSLSVPCHCACAAAICRQVYDSQTCVQPIAGVPKMLCEVG